MGALEKTGAIIVAVICAALGFIAMAVLTPSKFDYAAASEERKQQYLENIARGFERGFAATAGNMSEIKQIRANAQADAIFVDIRFIKAEVEYAPASAVDEYRQYVYKYNCAFLQRTAVLKKGVTLKIRTTRPSGALLTNFTLNAEGCAPYLNPA